MASFFLFSSIGFSSCQLGKEATRKAIPASPKGTDDHVIINESAGSKQDLDLVCVCPIFACNSTRRMGVLLFLNAQTDTEFPQLRGKASVGLTINSVWQSVLTTQDDYCEFQNITRVDEINFQN